MGDPEAIRRSIAVRSVWWVLCVFLSSSLRWGIILMMDSASLITGLEERFVPTVIAMASERNSIV